MRTREEYDLARRLAIRAYHRQGGLCFWCKGRMYLETDGGPRMMTAEHIVPVCIGGAATERNIVAVCHECNNRRGDAGARAMLFDPSRQRAFFEKFDEEGVYY